MRRAVVSGYYGFGNLGDEAILASLVQELAPRCELVVLSADPAATEAAYGVRAVPRMDLLAIASALRGADLFVSGGGGLLQDVTGPLTVAYYAGLMTMARTLGVPTAVFAQGLGPLTGRLNRMLAGWALRRSVAVTLRDAASVELARQLGVAADRLVQTADPVLLLRPAAPERIAAIVGELGLVPERPVVAVAIRPWHGWYERQFKGLASALSELVVENDAQLLLLPFQMPGDERITEELWDCLTSRPRGHAPRVSMLGAPLEPAEMLGLIGRCELVVGMRLHALIMAAASAVPALGLVYDPKVEQFCRTWSLSAMESIESLHDARALESKLASLWATREAQHHAMGRVLEGQAAAARRNFEPIFRLLGLDGPSEPVGAAETGV